MLIWFARGSHWFARRRRAHYFLYHTSRVHFCSRQGAHTRRTRPPQTSSPPHSGCHLSHTKLEELNGHLPPSPPRLFYHGCVLRPNAHRPEAFHVPRPTRLWPQPGSRTTATPVDQPSRHPVVSPKERPATKTHLSKPRRIMHHAAISSSSVGGQ